MVLEPTFLCDLGFRKLFWLFLQKTKNPAHQNYALQHAVPPDSTIVGSTVICVPSERCKACWNNKITLKESSLCPWWYIIGSLSSTLSMLSSVPLSLTLLRSKPVMSYWRTDFRLSVALAANALSHMLVEMSISCKGMLRFALRTSSNCSNIFLHSEYRY